MLKFKAMSNFNNHKKFIVFIGLISILNMANAGSYVDFFRALLRDDVSTTRQLLAEGFDPNTASEQAQPALLYALHQESYKAAKVLVADPRIELNQTNSQGETPLMLAALKGQTALAEAMVDQGAAVNKSGWTPLHYAAAGSKPEMVAMLLANEADLDAVSPNGTTALMMAARYGSPENVKLLLVAGANPELKNEIGLTALDFARQGARPDALKILTETLEHPQWPDEPDQPIQY